MLHNPAAAMLALSSHLAKDVLQLVAIGDSSDARRPTVEKIKPAEPICLSDAGWCDHYGHRHLDVDVERL